MFKHCINTEAYQLTKVLLNLHTKELEFGFQNHWLFGLNLPDDDFTGTYEESNYEEARDSKQVFIFSFLSPMCFPNHLKPL